MSEGWADGGLGRASNPPSVSRDGGGAPQGSPRTSGLFRPFLLAIPNPQGKAPVLACLLWEWRSEQPGAAAPLSLNTVLL